MIAWAIAVLGQDLATRRISNFLSLGAILGTLVFLVAAGKAPLDVGWQSALLGAGLGLLLTLPGYLLQALGAGDVKLLVAIGLIGGWQAVLVSFIVAGLIAGVAALWLLATRKKKPHGRMLPFGAALAAGLLVSVGWQPWA